MTPDQPVAAVLGDAACDLTFWKDRDLPVVCNFPLEVKRGGTAANTAVGLARQGVPVEFFGVVGDDPLGMVILDDLAREGVDTAGVRVRNGVATPQVLYAIDEDGSLWGNTVWPPLLESAIFALEKGDVDIAHLRRFGWLHVVGLCFLKSPLRETALAVMEAAKEQAVPVSLDLNLRAMESVEIAEVRSALERAVESTSYLLGSASQEFSVLFPDSTPEEAARRIAERGCTVILRMSKDGATAISADRTVTVPALSVDPVSPVGAGDAFNAGFITALLRGEEVEAGVRRGNATAALTISRAEADAPSGAAVEAKLAEAFGPAGSTIEPR
ncbi:MAG: sugar kinase [Actinobacteria bacterium]|nr:sugar kinase [Actinomycetota bacterium]